MTVVPAKAGTHDHRLWNMGPRLRGDDYMVGANAAMLMMVVKRMLIAVPSLIGVVIVTFLLTRALPGDPAAYFAGPAATKEAIRADPREAWPR